MKVQTFSYIFTKLLKKKKKKVPTDNLWLWIRSLKEVALLEGGGAVEGGGVGGGVVVYKGSYLLLCGWEGLGVGTSWRDKHQHSLHNIV